MTAKIKRRSEHEEQVALFKWIRMFAKSYPALDWVFAIPNAAKRSKALAGMMRAEGLTAGVFDLFVPWPVGKYHGLFIEMKRPPNTLTQAQGMFGSEMIRRGYLATVCLTADEAINVIRGYVGIK